MADVLITTIKEGHLSLAQAAAECCQELGLEAEIAVFAEPILHFYTAIYRVHPKLFLVFFWLTNRDWTVGVSSFFLRFRRGEIEELLDQHQPKLIINTSFGFTPALKQITDQTPIPVINIVPNPRTFFKGDCAPSPIINACFDEQQLQAFRNIDSTVKLHTTGWLVRKKFFANFDQDQLRTQLGLLSKTFMIVLSLGSEGAPLSLLHLQSFLKNNPKCQIVIMTGSNELQRTTMRLHKKTLPSSDQRRVFIVGYTNQVAEYFAASDVVLGKAGPNSLFEAIACGKPFGITTWIGGLEDGNVELTKELKVGAEITLPKFVADDFLATIDKAAIDTTRQKLLDSRGRFKKLITQTLNN